MIVSKLCKAKIGIRPLFKDLIWLALVKKGLRKDQVNTGTRNETAKNAIVLRSKLKGKRLKLVPEVKKVIASKTNKACTVQHKIHQFLFRY